MLLCIVGVKKFSIYSVFWGLAYGPIRGLHQRGLYNPV